MKKILAIAAAASVMAASLPLYAADSSSGKKGTVIAEAKVEEQAIVRDMDLAKRTLTLAMPNGSLKTVRVDERVKRFDKILPGDVVKTIYSEAVTVRLRKTKIQPGVKVEESLSREPEKIKPAGKSERQVTTTATITAISADCRTVSLKGPDGNVEEVDVRNPSNLKKLRSGEVKVGDQIDITYSQAFALSVEKATQGVKP